MATAGEHARGRRGIAAYNHPPLTTAGRPVASPGPARNIQSSPGADRCAGPSKPSRRRGAPRLGAAPDHRGDAATCPARTSPRTAATRTGTSDRPGRNKGRRRRRMPVAPRGTARALSAAATWAPDSPYGSDTSAPPGLALPMPCRGIYTWPWRRLRGHPSIHHRSRNAGRRAGRASKFDRINQQERSTTTTSHILQKGLEYFSDLFYIYIYIRGYILPIEEEERLLLHPWRRWQRWRRRRRRRAAGWRRPGGCRPSSGSPRR